MKDPDSEENKVYFGKNMIENMSDNQNLFKNAQW
jgi:hypothetical protein